MKVPEPGSMPLKPQRSSGRIVRPGEIIEVEPMKTTPQAPRVVRQSQGLFQADQPTDELDPKNVPEDQVEVFDHRGPVQEGRWKKWIRRIAPERFVD